MSSQPTQKDVDEYIKSAKAYTAKLITQGPEACKEFLYRVLHNDGCKCYDYYPDELKYWCENCIQDKVVQIEYQLEGDR